MIEMEQILQELMPYEKNLKEMGASL